MDDRTLHLTLDLPLGPEAAAIARRTVRAALLAWGLHDDDLSYDACLVVTELVSNAVRHGGSSVVLEVTSDAPHLTVAAVDGSEVLPEPRSPGQDSEGGRGVAIIEAVTCRWGVQAVGSGKRVWAELDLGDRGSACAPAEEVA